MEQGAMSVTFQDPGGDPVLEPEPGTSPLWQRVRVTALFEEGESPNRIAAAMTRELGEVAVRDWAVERLQDQQWERAWMDAFAPMRFGHRLWVCPSNGRVDDADAIILKLDPGLAFGTGTHPTTALCLDWLDSLPLQGRRVIDYGCGSGILSVAALLLGADAVAGIDNDPQALTASLDNAQRNGVDHRLERHTPESAGTLPPAQVVVANILAGTLIRLAPVISRLVSPGGRLALSGILENQSRSVVAAYAHDCPLDVVAVRDGWALLAGVRRSGQA